jgi:hypothetical protein
LGKEGFKSKDDWVNEWMNFSAFIGAYCDGSHPDYPQLSFEKALVESGKVFRGLPTDKIIESLRKVYGK